MADRSRRGPFISSVTVGEIWRGILEKPQGRKRKELERWFAGAEGPLNLFAGRVLPFDHQAGLVWARLMAEGTRTGRPRSLIDMVIAAIAEVNGCVLVTGNEKHFAGIKMLNPLRPESVRARVQ